MLFFNMKKVYQFYEKMLKNIINIEFLINKNHLPKEIISTFTICLLSIYNNSISFITFYFLCK